MGKHGQNATKPDKSIFSISNDEVKALLQSKEVVKSPIYNPISNGITDTNKFVRQVDVGKIIGINRYQGNPKPTSVITVITNRQVNLINVYPGSF